MSDVIPGGERKSSEGSHACHYDKAEIERLWEHLLHEDNMFIQVSNFFLVAQ